MAPRKSERILNLTICLLAANRFVDKHRIRQAVEGYAGLSDEAFERTFERDKEELRRMGVPVETGSNSAYFDDEAGYRIRRADFELPPVEFTQEEAAALGLAAHVWEQANLADAAVGALAKLRAAGVEPDPSRAASLAPRVNATEASFEPLWQATLSRTPVTFGYRDEVRRLEPWTVQFRRGAWYVRGRDLDKDAARTFKLSRITGDVRPVGTAGSYTVPDAETRREFAAADEAALPDDEAILAIRDGSAPVLVRQAMAAPDVLAPHGYSAYRMLYRRRFGLVGEVAAYGPDVLVLAPAELRNAVVDHLKRMLAPALRDGGAA